MHFVALNWGPKFSDYYLPDDLHARRLSKSDPTTAAPSARARGPGRAGGLQLAEEQRSLPARGALRPVYYFERFDKLKEPSFHPKMEGRSTWRHAFRDGTATRAAEEALAASKDGGTGRAAIRTSHCGRPRTRRCVRHWRNHPCSRNSWSGGRSGNGSNSGRRTVKTSKPHARAETSLAN